MPFEVPGHLITMKTERSKSQGNDSTVRVDLNTTRALSAPVQDRHGISPIDLQQSRRSVGIGNVGSPSISNNNQTSKVQPTNGICVCAAGKGPLWVSALNLVGGDRGRSRDVHDFISGGILIGLASSIFKISLTFSVLPKCASGGAFVISTC
jgi:hypothetical protein